MDKSLPIGSIGTADFKVSGGAASASASETYSKTFGSFITVKGTATEEVDVDLVGLLNFLKPLLESKSPALLKPIEDFTFAELISLASQA